MTTFICMLGRRCVCVSRFEDVRGSEINIVLAHISSTAYTTTSLAKNPIIFVID